MDTFWYMTPKEVGHRSANKILPEHGLYLQEARSRPAISAFIARYGSAVVQGLPVSAALLIRASPYIDVRKNL